MTKQMYLINYDCAHWCGGDSHCVVWAEDAVEAELEAGLFMEEHMRELFQDEYNEYYDDDSETGIYDNESAVSVISVELFNETHEQWKFFQDPSQAEFYPVIGTPE